MNETARTKQPNMRLTIGLLTGQISGERTSPRPDLSSCATFTHMLTYTAGMVRVKSRNRQVLRTSAFCTLCISLSTKTASPLEIDKDKKKESWLRLMAPYIHRLGAMFLISAGAYLIYYWVFQAGLVS